MSHANYFVISSSDVMRSTPRTRATGLNGQLDWSMDDGDKPATSYRTSQPASQFISIQSTSEEQSKAMDEDLFALPHFIHSSHCIAVAVVWWEKRCQNERKNYH